MRTPGAPRPAPTNESRSEDTSSLPRADYLGRRMAARPVYDIQRHTLDAFYPIAVVTVSSTNRWHARLLLHLLSQAKVLLSRDHTDGVGVAHTAAPSLDTDNVVTLVDDAELEGVVDTPLETAVNILLPDLDVEVGLLLGEEEGPDTTVQVRVLDSTR